MWIWISLKKIIPSQEFPQFFFLNLALKNCYSETYQIPHNPLSKFANLIGYLAAQIALYGS